MYGFIIGDWIWLVDINLLVEVIEDWCGGLGLVGDEVVFGGGKVLCEFMG